MNSRDVKQIRSQLRQIAKELLPESLATAIATEQYARLQKEIYGKLQVIQAQVTETLTRLDERSKEMQMFVARQVASGVPVPETLTEGVPVPTQEST